MKKGKRVWKSCASCSQFQPAKQEGVCAYLTDYNASPVFVHRNFRCVKYFNLEESKSNGSKSE